MDRKIRYRPLSDKEEEIAKKIVEAAFRVHKELGPGLLENVYEVCFCHELRKMNSTVERQKIVPIIYDGIRFDAALRVDAMVDDLVICEIKAVEKIIPLYLAQLLSYMKLMNKRLGFLINFNVPVIKEGIKRVIL